MKTKLVTKETVNTETGEVTTEKFNEVIIHETRRPEGSIRYQLDFSNCPTMAEQHTAHLTNINYLMEKYKPDELAAYLAARNQYRQEITGHDFSREPDIQEAKNIIYESKQAFEELDPDIKNNFSSHIEFLKFIDNPNNVQKMIKLGIMTLKEVERIQIPDPALPVPPPHGDSLPKKESP